jgi:hypothetical protein
MAQAKKPVVQNLQRVLGGHQLPLTLFRTYVLDICRSRIHVLEYEIFSRYSAYTPADRQI